MGIENLFIRNKREIAGLKIDGVITESTIAEVRATTNPVEFGADITDHVIREPTTIILDGVVTDTPLGLAALAESIGGATDAVSGQTGSSEPRGLTRSQLFYKKLVALLHERQLIEITTKLDTYEDLVFLSISVDQDKSSSQAVFFTAIFLEALLVEGAEQTTNDQDNIQGDAQAKGWGDTENAGTVATTQPSVAATEVILK